MLQSNITIATVLTISFLIGCQNKTETKILKKQDLVEVKAELTVPSRLDEAKEIVNNISYLTHYRNCENHTEKCTNFCSQQLEALRSYKLRRKELDLLINPLQKRLDSLRLLLTAEEKNELKNSNRVLVSEIMDTGILYRLNHIEPRNSLH